MTGRNERLFNDKINKSDPNAMLVLLKAREVDALEQITTALINLTKEIERMNK